MRDGEVSFDTAAGASCASSLPSHASRRASPPAAATSTAAASGRRRAVDDQLPPATGPARRHAHDRRRAGARLLRLDRRSAPARVGLVDGAVPDACRWRSATIVEGRRRVENVPGPVLTGDADVRRPTPVETITYNINPKAMWSDGVPITCADFQYTADQISRTARTSTTAPATPTSTTVDVPRPEDRGRHVQAGQDVRRLAAALRAAASASCRRTS